MELRKTNGVSLRAGQETANLEKRKTATIEYRAYDKPEVPTWRKPVVLAAVFGSFIAVLGPLISAGVAIYIAARYPAETINPCLNAVAIYNEAGKQRLAVRAESYGDFKKNFKTCGLNMDADNQIAIVQAQLAQVQAGGGGRPRRLARASGRFGHG